MSSIKTTQIDGDVSVGRNVAIGGKGSVAGNFTVGHNLKVDGWLDAKNIKGANKGVFTDITSLRTAYPDGTLPDGSWAIVGGTLPGELWYVNGGAWVDSGKTAGNVTVDVEQYLEEVQTMNSDIESMKGDISDIQKKNDTQDANISNAQNGITANTALIGKLSTDLSTETSERKTADNTLGQKISDEASARANSDTNLQTTLQGNIDAEAEARAKADKLLQGNIDALAKAGYLFKGIATPKTTPEKPTKNVFYIATESGSYSNFGTGIFVTGLDDNTVKEVTISVSDGEIAFLMYDGYPSTSLDLGAKTVGWYKVRLDISSAVETAVKNRLRGVKNGVAPLDEQEVVPMDYLPTWELESNYLDVIMVDYWVKDGDNLPLANASNEGKYYYDEKTVKLFHAEATTQGDVYVWNTQVLSDKIIYVDKTSNMMYRYDSTKNKLIAVSSNSSGGAYNPSAEDGRLYVLCDTSDTSNSAVHVAKRNGEAKLGLLLTFALKKGTWKTYQYVGSNTDDESWYDTDNWKDFGSMVQGSEAMIDLDTLVPLPTGYYTLGTALSALKTYQESTGVSYQKRGLVISYAVEANKVETKQYQGDSALTDDFWEASLWQDFGGGSKLVASDTMEDGGTDAFSTGGAYKAVPAEIEADTSNEGSVKIQLKNKGGDVLSEAQFPVGTGTGGGGGTTLAINFEDDPFYVRAGGTAILKAAIRSVTQLADGSSQDNKITSVVFTNRTTKTVVASFRPNQASSSSLKAYNFEFDLSGIAQNAGSVELQAVATDSTGQTATRNCELIAVDVTVESSQTLNYTKDTSLQVGGVKVSIPMYRFPHNASDKGIQTKIEIYKNSAWEVLDNVMVRDTYTHNVTIDPTGLGHGAYPLRIQGTDVASGITGNVLHTAVMVIEQRESVSDYNKPIIVARWSDANDGKVKLFQTITFDIACYQRNNVNPTVDVNVTDVTKGTSESVASKTMNRNSYYSVEKRIVGYSNGDTLTFDATSGEASLVEKLTAVINGSLLSIAETEGAYYKISLAGRSNSDTDKSIKATASDGNEVSINVIGSNYSSNGFVADNFGTNNATGRMALRVAENVIAECSDKPFASNTIPTNGLALSMTFKVRNIADRNAQIIRCMGSKLGFVLTGEKFIVTTNGDSDEALKNVQTTAATSYLDDTEYRIDIVIEPQSQTGSKLKNAMLCKVFQNGDESACVPIDTSNGFPSFGDTIHFDGTDADLYLFEITRWNSYYDFIQAFNNYIVNLTDTQAMLTEYEQNQVMVDVTAEGRTKPRPDMQKLLDRGVMVCVMTRTADKNLSSDGSAVSDSNIYYPDYIEDLKDKKTSVLMDWYLYFPDRPWANCKVEAVPVTNQGTSTLAYAIKNKKAKFKKGKGITLLYSRDEISTMYSGDEDILRKYDDAAKLAKKKKIRIKEGSTPINTITVKVDYSDSAGANNCALMEQMNDVQMALGNNYTTPAQNFDTDKSEQLHTSIDGITCALFRTDYRIGQDNGSEAATLPENAYFHSKANFNADKGNPHFFGFEDVEGYNLGCVNYGDFKEMVTPRGTDIDDYKATVLADTSSLVPGTLYMLSEFCGPKYRFLENDGTGKMTETSSVSVDEEHVLDKTLAEVLADDVSNYDWGTAYATSDGKFVQYKGGNWKDTTGSMTFDKATRKWSITGRVLNPVECYEYRQYQEFCWQQGVNTVDDMLKTLHTDDGDVPVWSTYYESRYPDDDDLNDLYAQGKKVPYRLFAELQFCQQCNQNLSDDATANAATNTDGSEKVFNGTGASTTINLDGKEVPGTKENRRLKWQHEMHKWFNPYSTQCYVVSSDYKATVDQRAKNMMIGFYLETDGTVRGYFNHWYDGDSCDEADNDCYLTIPWDMDGATSHLYQGWDGVMFRQCYALFDKGEGVWLSDDPYTKDASGNKVLDASQILTLHDVASAMRATKTAAGLDIFSADGCYRYWMTNRILKWPKVVSSFDGERKYIETATDADNHFPALHGLRLDSLPAFQRKRFAYRDGYFQCGDLFKKFFQARMMGAITVKITAAQDGYFGMGVDSTSSAKYSCYLRAGESHTFTETASGEGGKLIYIFGADKLATLDLSGCTPKNSNWMIADCTLLRKLIIGGDGYNPTYTNDILSGLSLGQMPFLEEIDIRNTKILTLDASGCPRLQSVLAEGSLLQTFNVAEASPITTLHLPATMTDLKFVNLPKLSYGTEGGMTIEGFGSVTRFMIEGCPLMDSVRLLTTAVDGGAKIGKIRITGLATTGKSTTLQAIMDAGATGLNSDGSNIDETGVCSGLAGIWTTTDYTDEAQLAKLQAYFTELTLYNAQYTMLEFDDAEENGYDANIRNLDNNTKDGIGDGYKPSGHITKLQKQLHVYKGTFNESSGKMRLEQVSDSDLRQLASGGDNDVTDTNGVGYDFFLGLPHYWYKGINDHANQKKYIVYSTEEKEPRSSANKVNRMKLGTILEKALTGVYVANYKAGDVYTVDELTASSANNTYRMNVEGMKQVRWPGINSNLVGGVFLDARGNVVSTVYTYITHALSDFIQGDYVFTAVPANAVTFIFTTPVGYDDLECIAVDSSDIEAIEPDWVEHKFELIGCYKASVDNLMRLRSISGANPAKGNGTSSTSAYWKYDTNGELTVGLPQSGTVLNYTCTDFHNLAKCRGKGYQLVDYEQHKDIANLWMAIHGRRNSQAVNGSGVGTSTTGGTDGTTDPSPFRETTTGRCRTLGLEDWWGCLWEWMDNVVVNVTNITDYYKNRMVSPSGSQVNAVWHVLMADGTERAVQGVSNSGDNQTIARVRHGRYCDVVPSKCVTNSSNNTYYCDAQWYSASIGRCVLRSGDFSHSYDGFVHVYAYHDSASANGSGSRLAFRGEYEFVK